MICYNNLIKYQIKLINSGFHYKTQEEIKLILTNMETIYNTKINLIDCINNICNFNNRLDITPILI